MSLARFFSKPRWQSKDESARRAAVASDQEPELIEALPRLAREDSDAGVRIAAMKRLADPGLTQAMASDDRDEGVRVAARSLWAELLSGTHAAAPSLADRLRLLRAQDDPRLIEQIATSAPEAPLRLAALQRIDRQTLILDRATTDADPEVRLAALARIDDEGQLARIVERTRRTDKTINRLAAERLENLRVERGDVDAIALRARQLCERLERVLREGDGSEEAADIASAWTGIADKAPPTFIARYRNARELYELSRNPDAVARLRQRAEDRVRIEEQIGTLERLLAEHRGSQQRDELMQRYDELAEQHAAYAQDVDDSSAGVSVRFARLGAQIAALEPLPRNELAVTSTTETEDSARLAEQTERAAQAKAAKAAAREQKIQAWSDELQAAIEATASAMQTGKTAEAHTHHASIGRLRRQIGSVPASLRERLADVESEYAKIAEWQRWSDNERRRQLCDELELLPQAGLHPDALATRVREIQAEWTHLDQIEARSVHATEGMARHFRALCRKAIEPAKPYFEKRDELRKQGTKETSELIAQARTDAAAEEPDLRALPNLRRQLADALRGLDRVDPRERKNLAAEIKAALALVDERVSARNATVEAAKAALTDRATALGEVADTRTAISQARDLQKLWQKAGNGKRSRDQAQWKTFRSAIDAVFARADNERVERSAQERKALESAAGLCAELEALAIGDAQPERAAVQRIESAWRELSPADAALRQRFQSAQSRLAELGRRIEKQRHRAQFDIWLSHYELCRQLERSELAADGYRAAEAGLPPLTLGGDALRARIGDALEGQELEPGDPDLLRDCVLEIEQLAGLEPPAEDRQRRMDLQLEKLSARMRGVNAPAPDTALQNLLAEWLQLGPVGVEDAPLETRFKRALHAALDTLG
ncbi:DUF349 domain-containing protein [Dokdonella immobilis]|uniref:DUF349 domain-containing protein n=1 Tax=Dokdonella immobilis TaxID=578942 RepID=A0A1I5AAX5_9GAMM|nr:DUF349 domain-containing protein [Dokdonella immobilis]SFN59528.1 protein of unknown function [Dokdonella immobilis]